jgi:hypothetical protein
MSPSLKTLARVFMITSLFTLIVSLVCETKVLGPLLTQFSIAWWITILTVSCWFLSGISLFMIMLFNRQARENLLASFAQLKERDEREEEIVGRASRSSFLFMLSIFLLFGILSTFRYEHKVGSTDSSGKIFSIGHWSWLEKHPPAIQTEFNNGQNITVESSDIPISKTGLITFFLLLQLGSFWVFARPNAKFVARTIN